MTRIAGIDVGGTFTDLILLETAPDGAASIRIAKTPTTVRNQADGVVSAIAQSGTSPGDLDLIVHGTTTTTNAVLERKTAVVGLITTEGFRDVLELGRRTRPAAYGMTGQFEPLIPRELRLGVPERMLADGTVHVPLDEERVADAAHTLLTKGAEAVVIHFLHSYANSDHERRAGEIVRGLWPNAYVTLGHELLSEYREYERGTTASVNAAVQPILDRYVARLQGALNADGFDRDLLVMNGNGGTVSARIVARDAAKTVMSGPAAGVSAAAAVLRHASLANAITYDMGGTSTDVALIRNFEPDVSSELQIAYGLPIHLPMVDVRTVGAGGGSIGWIDAGGLLKVGPESAGADPGPICYGRGGSRPTVTDANMLLGRLDPDRLLAVDNPVTLEHVRARFQKVLGDPLGINAEDAADAVVRLANINMAGAIRMVSLSKGHDPRDFVLFAFGGAGPLHAVALARELAIPRVLVPARPGLTNALGCLVADLRQDFVSTVNRPVSEVDFAMVRAIFEEHAANGKDRNAAEGAQGEGTLVRHSVDMLYKGQTHLIRVALDGADQSVETMAEAFGAAFEQRFSMRLPEMRPVLVNLNTTVIAKRSGFDLAALAETDKAPARVGERRIVEDGRATMAGIYRRADLRAGDSVDGPAIIAQLDTTTFLPTGATATVDPAGNLMVQV
ncbi:MAG: hydantoinase/oxoprolinase family protein [Pseudomonadota bacterium]